MHVLLAAFSTKGRGWEVRQRRDRGMRDGWERWIFCRWKSSHACIVMALNYRERRTLQVDTFFQYAHPMLSFLLIKDLVWFWCELKYIFIFNKYIELNEDNENTGRWTRSDRKRRRKKSLTKGGMSGFVERLKMDRSIHGQRDKRTRRKKEISCSDAGGLIWRHESTMNPSQSKSHFHFSALTTLLDCLGPLTVAVLCVCVVQEQI